MGRRKRKKEVRGQGERKDKQERKRGEEVVY